MLLAKVLFVFWFAAVKVLNSYDKSKNPPWIFTLIVTIQGDFEL